MSDDHAVIRFAEKLVMLLDQGGFTATYKYAVMLALMDLCREQCARDGAPPTMLTTVQIAHKVMEIYWTHTRSFDNTQLRQNASGQAQIISLIARFQSAVGVHAGTSLFRARAVAPVQCAALEREVEWKLVQMPLPRLQRIGQHLDAFLYQIHWNDTITRGVFESAGFDNRLLLPVGVPENLVTLSGVLRPLIHRHWISRVTSYNNLPESRVEAFLFGRERASLAVVYPPLLALQQGVCFYCSKALRARGEVDHFIPWARHPDNGIDNLVVAHAECNNNKRDFLVDIPHVEGWVQRALDQASFLQQIASTVQWERDTRRTTSILRAVYRNLPDAVPLWHARGEFVALDRTALNHALNRVVDVEA